MSKTAEDILAEAVTAAESQLEFLDKQRNIVLRKLFANLCDYGVNFLGELASELRGKVAK